MRCFLYWSGSQWPLTAELCIESLFRPGGFDEVVLCVDERPTSSAFERQAEHLKLISPEDFFDATAMQAYAALDGQRWKEVARSDFFSYYALHRHGGFYFDLDVIALRDFAELPKSASLVGREEAHIASIGVMYFEAGHPVLADLLATIANSYRGGFNDLGPRFLSQHFGRLFVAPVETFYPWDYQSWRLPFSEVVEAPSVDDLLARNVFAVHLWGEMMRRANFSPDRSWVRSHPEALFSRLATRILGQV